MPPWGKKEEQLVAKITSMAMKEVQGLSNTKSPKGKGKGKASGKGQPAAAGAKTGALPDQTSPLLQGAWCCAWAHCKTAQSGRPNFASRKRCAGCGLVKHEAMNPPQRCRIVPKAPPSFSAKEAEANKKAEEFKARALTAAQKKTESASASAADKDSVQSKEKEPPPPPPFVPIAPSPPPLETTEAAAAVARMAKDSRKVGFTKEEAERFTAVAPCLAEGSRGTKPETPQRRPNRSSGTRRL